MTTLPEYPVINRARAYYLYDDRGKRYLDFYQDGGRAILGHRPVRLSTQLKNLLSKGLLGQMPSKYTYRLLKACRELLPEYPHVRIYEHFLKAEYALADAGILEGDTERVPDILDPSISAAPRAVIWRPFLENIVEYPEIVMPILPFPGGFGPGIVCFREDPGTLMPPSDLCSPFVLAGTVRIVYDLLREISVRNREEWPRFEGKKWKRFGPYLLPEFISKDEYRKQFNDLLRAGVLINPSADLPSIIPAEYSEGDVERFLRRL